MEQILSGAILILFSPQNGEFFVIASDRNPTQNGISKKENLIVPVAGVSQLQAWLDPEVQIMPKEIRFSPSLGSASLCVRFMLRQPLFRRRKHMAPVSHQLRNASDHQGRRHLPSPK